MPLQEATGDMCISLRKAILLAMLVIFSSQPLTAELAMRLSLHVIQEIVMSLTLNPSCAKLNSIPFPVLLTSPYVPENLC